MNGDQIDPSNDRKLVTQLGIRDKTVSVDDSYYNHWLRVSFIVDIAVVTCQ